MPGGTLLDSSELGDHRPATTPDVPYPRLMHVILVPGLWLDTTSWSAVTPLLEAAGHTTHALTLPGLESRSADRTGIGLADHVAAVVAAIDASPADARVALVGHSAGSGIAWAAVDARPDQVAAAVLVGGFPTPDGEVIADGFEARDGEVALPDLSEFSPEDLAGLDEAALARFRDGAIPMPEGVVRDPQRLSDERRYDVPVTLVCPEYTPEMVREWAAQGAPILRELGRIQDLRYVDLPTGHWPQLSDPALLAEAILAALAA